MKYRKLVEEQFTKLVEGYFTDLFEVHNSCY